MFNYKLYRLQRKLIYKKYGFLAFFILIPHQFRFLEVTNLQKYVYLLEVSQKIQRFFLNIFKNPITWILLTLIGISYYIFEAYGLQINNLILELNKNYLKLIN